VPDQEPSLIRRQLAAELVRLRSIARISGRRMAELLGVSQATLSRMDRGVGPAPAAAQLETWLDATKAGPDDRDRILALALRAHNEATHWPDLLSHHAGNLQGVAAERESAAVRVRNFQPTVVAGLLQTAVYTQALLPLADPTGQIDRDATMAGRVRRQQILYEPGRSFHFLIAESVLYSAPGPNALAGQCDRIIQLTELPSIEVAVLPTAPMVATPWHGFNFYERSDNTATVFLELIHRTEEVVGPESVELYRTLWERLWSAAAHGEDAVALIRKAGHEAALDAHGRS
jgi:transcriptional regulator with XRE-family HTH domain